MVSPKEAYEVVLDSAKPDLPHLLWKTELNGQLQILSNEPSRGWWQRLEARMLALLPLQPEL